MTAPEFNDGTQWTGTDSSFDLSNVEPEPIEFGVPAYKVVDDKPPKEPPLTMKERLKAMTSNKDSARPRNVRKTATKTVPNVPGQFIEPLTDFYNFIGLAVMPFDPEITMTMVQPCRAPKDDEDPSKIPTVAENCARTLDEAAQRSESLRRVLSSFTAASVWGAVIAAHMPLIAVVAKNHTPLGERLDPARAMEAMLKREATPE